MAQSLEEQLCFALYATSRAMTAEYRPLLQAIDLTFPQYLVMLALWEHRTPRTVSELGTTLRLDSGTLSPLLRRLETIGYVERSRRPGDDRAVLIGLTAEGRKIKARVKRISAKIADRLDPDEVSEIRGQLWALEKQLREG